jgi:broad specificity phosphatase PhoE
VTTTLLLARHGETDWNRDGRWQGHADTALNALGREQARELAESLAGEPLAAVYASDLSRARETAEIVARARGLPVVIDERLREINFGAWEGLTTPEVEERFPEAVEAWRMNDGFHEFTGGETYDVMGARVVAALEEIARAHPGEQVLVVLHGGPIRGLLAHAAGISYREQRRLRAHLANCDVIRVAVRDGIFTPID